jgi:hypothetical protein
MPAIGDLVHQTSSTTGTGNLTLAAVNGKQTFASVFSTGGTDVFYYFVSNRNAAEWEVGTGHMSDSTTLVRDTVLVSSNSNAAVNFTTGTLDIANDLPASLQVNSADLGTMAAEAAADYLTAAGIAAAYQPLDSDLTAVAALSPSNDDFLQRKAGAWANRTVAQVKTDLSLSGTNTGDQTSVTGNAGTATALQTARNIDGQAFDGTGNITVIAPGTHAATSKSTPVDADELPLVDSAASNVLKKLTWANLKATLGATFAALAGSVSQAFSAASIELGHASDTTLSRASAGRLAVEGVNVVTISSTDTLTNKRITPRVTSETSSATPTINTDNSDFHRITALAANITSFTTNLSGTPTHGQKLIVEITGTATRTISWGSSFESSTATLPTTTVGTATLLVGFVWNSATSKWRCVAVA